MFHTTANSVNPRYRFFSLDSIWPKRSFVLCHNPFWFITLAVYSKVHPWATKRAHTYEGPSLYQNMTSFVSHRKICKSCKCSQEDHSLSSDAEDDRKIGRLLADSKYSSLTARVKGSDGIRIYKRNRMIITNPIVSRKDPTFDTITYEWAPPGLTQKLVRKCAQWHLSDGVMMG